MKKISKEANKKKYTVKGFAFIGRTFNEYKQMFELSATDLQSNSFLDCPGGSCSFTAEATKQNIEATALDIEYGKSPDIFKTICENETKKIKIGFSDAKSLFRWDYYKNLDNLISIRETAARLFLNDYVDNPTNYNQCTLPSIPLNDDSFDIVLSGHFLFLYADRLPFEFHLKTIEELLRVCKKEIRIYPLIGLDGKRYPELDALLEILKTKGFSPSIKKIDFEFLKGSNHLLIIKKH
jgi:hypothetical protein